MGDDLWHQIGVQEGIRRYVEIRKRLRRPPNAVKDEGINLKRLPPKPTPPPPSKPTIDLTAKRIAEQQWKARVEAVRALYPPVPKFLTIGTIFNLTALAFGITPEEIRSDSRRPIHSFPRQVGMYLTKKLLYPISFPQIARFFGMDHTSVIYGVKKVQRLVAVDPDLAAKLSEIEASLPCRSRSTYPCRPPRTASGGRAGDGPTNPPNITCG